MKIYDISQEVLSSTLFPGDPAPEGKKIMSMEDGDVCNLSTLFMCAHNGTHTDAPAHFFIGGKTIDQMPVDIFVGECYVAEHQGMVTALDAEMIMKKATEANANERILIAGKATVSNEAAEIFAAHKIKLIGNESQTVGDENAPARAHEILLGEGIALLEGLRLNGVKGGKYILSSAPLNLAGFDGSPCRAVLIEL